MCIPPKPESMFRDHLSRLRGEAGWAARNLRTGRTLIHNERRFLAASTIKLPILAHYAECRGEARFTSAYIYDPADYCEDSPCFDKIAAGAGVSWDDLAEWMMVLSDNTATNLLIDALGLPALQAWIGERGWQTMALNRRMMDLAARARGVDNWASPAEMMDFMERLVRRELTRPDACDWTLEVLHRCQDLEKIPFRFAAPVQVANKPGELPGTRSDVGYVHDESHEVVMALFTDHLPDEQAEIDSDLWLADLALMLWEALKEDSVERRSG